MPGTHRRVAILYSHSLLGEGLAHLLRGDSTLRVELVHADDLEAAEAMLATQPEVVVVERGLDIRAIDLLRRAPNALVLDVGLDAGPSWAYHRDELSAQPDDVLRAIRGGSRRDRTSSGERPRGGCQAAVIEPEVSTAAQTETPIRP